MTARVAALLPIALPVMLVSLFLAVEARSLVAPDAWLALVAGREIVVHGLPSVDHLTTVSAGRSWIDQQWLAQIIFYRVDQWFGGWAVTALSLLAYVAAFGVAGWTACRRAARGWVVGVFFVAAVASSPWAMGTGPQSLALPLFALTILLVSRDPDARQPLTLWLLPLLCLWANLHGSVALGALVTTLFGLQALVRGRCSRAVALACVFAPMTLLVSPYALELPTYYRLMLIDPPFAGHVELWRRTTPGTLTAVFFTLAAISLVLVVRNRRRLRAIELVIVGLTLATALEAVRGIVWFALAALALFPPFVVPRTRRATASLPRALSRTVGRATIAPALFAASVAALVWGSTRPTAFYDSGVPPVLARILQAQQPSDRPILIDARYADWLLWKIPSLRGRVAYDARVELLTHKEILLQERFGEMRSNWFSSTTGYRLVISDRKHVDAMVAHGGWRRVYSHASIAVAARL